MSKRPDPMATAIDERELAWSLAAMAHPILSVPEGERAAWYRSMERYASTNRRQHTGVLDNGKLATLWCKIARVCWPDYPPQEPEDSAANSGAVAECAG